VTATAWKIGDETSFTPWVVNDGTSDVTVLLTCEPTDADVFVAAGGSVQYEFRGALSANRTVEQILYPALIDLLSQAYEMRQTNDPTPVPGSVMDIALFNLQAALSRHAGEKILVAGHSLGALVISRWLEIYPGTAGAPDPDKVQFIQIGNPVRKYGGLIPEFWGGRYTRTDSGYTVTDIKIQYDAWADWPTATIPSLEAVGNAILGIFPHTTGYMTTQLTSTSYPKYVEGDTTFVMIPNAFLPLAGYGLLGGFVSGLLRPLIEGSYTRPEIL
jgi:hypothetical protein